MDIQKLREKRFELEMKITELICEFEKETTTSVVDIKYDKLLYVASLKIPEISGRIVHVKLDI